MNKVITGLIGGAVLAGGMVVAAGPAAASTDWQVGECYQLTKAQLNAEVTPDATPVPCSGEHNVEVMFVGDARVATDSQKEAALRKYCAATDLYAAAGLPINKAVVAQSGSVLTYLGRDSWVSEDRTTLVCASAPVWFAKKGVSSNQTTTVTLAEYLQPSVEGGPLKGTCLKNPNPGKQLSVACDPGQWSRAPWIVWKIVNAEAKFPRQYPGNADMDRFARNQCELQDIPWAYTYPLEETWVRGGNVINCYRYAGL